MENHRISRHIKCFSDIIDINKLERESYRYLYLGFVIAVMFHTALALFWKFEIAATKIQEAERKYREPIPVDIIVLPPQIQNPYETWRKTISKNIPRRKKFTQTKPTADKLKNLISPRKYDLFAETESVDSLDVGYQPQTLTEISKLDKIRFSPEEFDYDKPIERVPRDLFSFKDEMLSVDDFIGINEGQIKGLVFYNPNDKMTIRGIIIIPHFFSATWPPKNLSPGIENLVDALNIFTDLRAVQDGIDFFHHRHLTYPFIYIACSDTWEYFPFEVKAIGDYLKSGGFALFDNLQPWMDFSAAEASLRQFIRDALGSKARFQPIPNDHPIYHCFFEFEDGPPLGSEVFQMSGHTMARSVHYLEGIWIDNRLAAVYSNKGYGRKWAARENNDPQLKIGINMVVYALLQAGGKGEKKIDYALTPGTKILRWNVEMTQQTQWEKRAENK